jgi:hypothetical protein
LLPNNNTKRPKKQWKNNSLLPNNNTKKMQPLTQEKRIRMLIDPSNNTRRPMQKELKKGKKLNLQIYET